MTHWRTSRATSGAQPLPGSPYGANTHAELIPFPSGSSLERRQISKPSFDERELGAGLLFLFVVLLPIAIVGGFVIGYATLAPEPIEYQRSVKAD